MKRRILIVALAPTETDRAWSLVVNLVSAMFSAINRGAVLDPSAAEAVRVHVDGG